MEYNFIHIDQSDPDLPALAIKYKQLRLEALKQSPASFSSTYDIESQFPDEAWLSRIQNPEKETFICTATTGGQTEWVGQVTIRGPLTAAEFRLPEASKQPDPQPDEEEEKWQMLSLYTLPTHRGKGLGKRLCQAVFDHLVKNAGTASRVLVRIMVKPENTATLSLYGSLGFERTGTCTLEEALRANGDAELLPKEIGESFKTRGGIIMALGLEKAQT